MRRTHEQGSAVVEFIAVVVVLLVPIVYAVMSLSAIEEATFAVHAAAKQAGRAYVQAGNDATGRYAAQRAAAMAARNHGIELGTDDVHLSCSTADCLQPGTEITVTVRTRVDLVRVPAGFPSGPVISATHTHRVDPYRAAA